MDLTSYIKEAKAKRQAIGHFNVSNIEGVWAIIDVAKEMKVPVIIGVSEGERDFIGVRQIAAIVKSIREEFGIPVFLNADHTYSFEKVREAVDAGFDAVIFDGTELPFEKNIEETKRVVEYVKATRPEVIVEAEIGFIGKSSQVHAELPKGVSISPEFLTKPEEAKQFVDATGVNLLAPSVGNVHGIIQSGEPALNIERIATIAAASSAPLVLHGASGNTDADIRAAIDAGVVIVHVNTELRVAYRKGLEAGLQANPHEVAPYKYVKPAREAMAAVVREKLKLFNK